MENCGCIDGKAVFLNQRFFGIEIIGGVKSTDRIKVKFIRFSKSCYNNR